MPSREENELLTRTNAGTPMGDLLRRYWVPALLSEELSAPDGPPLRVKLLGEELIAFRTSAGIGLLQEHCAHRGASLFFGRNEESGIRCVYHGWKYDVIGRCVDMPNEPAESNFKDRVRQVAYRCRERGGVIWAYLGPVGTEPPLPELEWALVPESQRYVSKRLQQCNYLQALEGGVDTSHIAFLHRNLDPARDAADQQLSRGDLSPRFEVIESTGGLYVAARRNAADDRYYWRINQFIMPWYTMFPPLVDAGIGGHAFVPIDDENCWVYNFTWDPRAPLAPVTDGIYGALIPGTFRPTANRDNDYLVDRDTQRTESYTGIPGFAAQDAMVQESMGPICDRTIERIGPTDLPVLSVRRRLMGAIKSVAAGHSLPGLDPVGQRVRPAALLLPHDVPFIEGAKDALQAQTDSYAVRV